MTAPDRITVTFDNWRNPNAGAAYKNDAGETAYIRADLVDPAAIREAAIRECADSLRKVIDYAAFAGADPDEVEDAAINSYADYLLVLIQNERGTDQ